MNEEIQNILDEWGAETVAAIQAVLVDRGNVATGALRRSIEYKLGGNFVQFTMADYGVYVEKGTKPHWAPIAPFKKWAKARGLSEKRAYATRGAIAKFGTKPHPFFTTIIEREIAKLAPKLEQSIIQYFGDRIELLNNQP